MSTKAKSSLTFAFLFSLVGCGQKLEALTDAQKTEFQEALRAVGAPMAQAKSSEMKTAVSRSRTSPDGRMADFAKKVEVATEDDDYFSDEQVTSIESGCEASFDSTDLSSVADEITEPEDLVGKTLSFSAQITKKEESCPLTLNVDFTVKVTEASQTKAAASLTLAAAYEILSTEMKENIDITKFSMDGTGSFTMSQSAQSAEFSADGELTSASRGTIGMYLTLEADAAGESRSGEMALGLKFPTYTAELKMAIDGTKTTYYLNDQEVTEAEAQAFLEKATGGTLESRASVSMNASSTGARPGLEFPHPSARTRFWQLAERLAPGLRRSAGR